MGTYTRDEILDKALSLIDAATLNHHDRRGGIIDPNAFCISWLQQSLDMYHSRYPFSADVTSAAMTISINQSHLTVTATPTLYVPANFMLDVKHGLVLTINSQTRRLPRKAFPQWLDVYNASLTQPQIAPLLYTIHGGRMHIAPLTTTAYAATLWYFAKPAPLVADSVPNFPDDWVLVEYVRIKGLEWLKQHPPGTASAYMRKELGAMKQAGLLNETEFDAFPIEQTVIAGRDGTDRNLWMGPPIGFVA